MVPLAMSRLRDGHQRQLSAAHSRCSIGSTCNIAQPFAPCGCGLACERETFVDALIERPHRSHLQRPIASRWRLLCGFPKNGLPWPGSESCIIAGRLNIGQVPIQKFSSADHPTVQGTEAAPNFTQPPQSLASRAESDLRGLCACLGRM